MLSKTGANPISRTLPKPETQHPESGGVYETKGIGGMPPVQRLPAVLPPSVPSSFMCRKGSFSAPAALDGLSKVQRKTLCVLSALDRHASKGDVHDAVGHFNGSSLRFLVENRFLAIDADGCWYVPEEVKKDPLFIAFKMSFFAQHLVLCAHGLEETGDIDVCINRFRKHQNMFDELLVYCQTEDPSFPELQRETLYALSLYSKEMSFLFELCVKYNLIDKQTIADFFSYLYDRVGGSNVLIEKAYAFYYADKVEDAKQILSELKGKANSLEEYIEVLRMEAVFLTVHANDFSPVSRGFEEELRVLKEWKRNQERRVGSGEPLHLYDMQRPDSISDADYVLLIDHYLDFLYAFLPKTPKHTREHIRCLKNAVSHFLCRNQSDEAMECVERALVLLDKDVGSDQRSVFYRAELILQKGRVYKALKDYERALSCMNEALRTGEEVLGKNHYFMGFVYQYIGFVYCDQKNYKAAWENMFKSYEHYWHVYGEHLETSDVCHNLVLIADKALAQNPGLDWVTSSYVLELRQKRVRILRNLLPQKEVLLADELNSLGVALFRNNRAEEAPKHIMEALDIYLKRGVVESASKMMFNLGVMSASEKGSCAKMQSFFMRCLAYIEEQRGVGSDLLEKQVLTLLQFIVARVPKTEEASNMLRWYLDYYASFLIRRQSHQEQAPAGGIQRFGVERAYPYLLPQRLLKDERMPLPVAIHKVLLDLGDVLVNKCTADFSRENLKELEAVAEQVLFLANQRMDLVGNGPAAAFQEAQLNVRRAHVLRGYVCVFKRVYAQAEKHFEQAVEGVEFPDAAMLAAQCGYAALRKEEGNHGSAVAVLQGVVGRLRDPRNGLILNNDCRDLFLRNRVLRLTYELREAVPGGKELFEQMWGHFLGFLRMEHPHDLLPGVEILPFEDYASQVVSKL